MAMPCKAKQSKTQQNNAKHSNAKQIKENLGKAKQRKA